MAFRMIISSTFVVLALTQMTAARELLADSDCEDDTCMEGFAKCGGTFFNVSAPCCDPAHSCVVKNYYYAQCLTEDRAGINVANGWDGTVLECEEMPEDVLGGPEDMQSRRLLDSMDGGYGMDCDDDNCGLMFDKCGGGYNTSTPCCDPSLSCVVKNWFYAQCLTEERAALNIVNEGWDGRVLMCQEMPDDAPKGPDSWEFNKTVEDVEYVVSRKLQEKPMPKEADCEDDYCVAHFEKCGGTFFNSSAPCCDDDYMCVVKNYFYAQCLSPQEAEENINMWGWDGRVLDCEEMPDDLMPEIPDEKMEGGARRMLAKDGMYGSYGMTYGDKAMYGDRELDLSTEAPAPAPIVVAPGPATAPVTAETEIIPSELVLGEGCNKCAPIFGQCGDKGDIVSCCGEGLQCTKKHGFYAQCLPPARAARNMENFGWDGAVLECGTVML